MQSSLRLYSRQMMLPSPSFISSHKVCMCYLFTFLNQTPIETPNIWCVLKWGSKTDIIETHVWNKIGRTHVSSAWKHAVPIIESGRSNFQSNLLLMTYHRFANATQVLSCKSCCVLVKVGTWKTNQITSTYLKEQLRLVVP